MLWYFLPILRMHQHWWKVLCANCKHPYSLHYNKSGKCNHTRVIGAGQPRFPKKPIFCQCKEWRVA